MDSRLSVRQCPPQRRNESQRTHTTRTVLCSIPEVGLIFCRRSRTKRCSGSEMRMQCRCQSNLHSVREAAVECARHILPRSSYIKIGLVRLSSIAPGSILFVAAARKAAEQIADGGVWNRNSNDTYACRR